MNTELKSFVEKARESGLKDEAIRTMLLEKGWDKHEVQLAVKGTGLEVPTPGSVTNDTSAEKRPSLSHLESALHHVVLWFFTGSSAVAITGAIASLYSSDVSSTALASMIAVTVITFIPYAILFARYVYKNKSQPFLTPNRVWSIISICLHSIGAMASAITMTVSLITGGIEMVTISAALILLLDLLVVKVYAFAAFGSRRHPRMRMAVLWSYLPILLVLFGSLFVMSSLKIGPAYADEALRKELVSSVREVNRFVGDTKALPERTEQVTHHSAITYEKGDARTYTLCGVFNSPASGYGYGNDRDYYSLSDNEASQPKSDAFVSESTFENEKAGKYCFKFTNEQLDMGRSNLYDDVAIKRSVID